MCCVVVIVGKRIVQCACSRYSWGSSSSSSKILGGTSLENEQTFLSKIIEIQFRLSQAKLEKKLN